MIEFKVDGVDIFNPIKDKMPEVIEYLVKFYGEKYREQITSKLNNAHFLFLPKENIYSTRSIMTSYYEERFREIRKKCWKEAAKIINPNCSDSLLQLCSSVNFDSISKLREDFKKGSFLTYRWLDIYSFLGFDFDEDAGQNELKTFFADKDNYQKCLKGFDILLETWERYKEVYNRLQDEAKENVEKLKALEGEKIDYHEMRLKLVEKLFKKHLAKHKIKGFSERVFDSKEELYETVDDYLSGSKIRNPIELKEFIKLFRAMGFEHGKNIEDYENAPEIQAFFQNEEIKKDYKEIMNEIGRTRANSNVFYNEAIKDLQAEGKLYGINGLAAPMNSFIFYGSVNGYVNIALGEDGCKTFCILPQYLMLENRVAIHEMGHIIDVNFLEIDGKDYIKMGFSFSKNDFKQTGSDYDIRRVTVEQDVFGLSFDSFELFNEVVNDYFAVEIANQMEEDGFSLGVCSDGNSFYSRAFVLMKDFIEENKQDLIDCKMTGNEKIIDERFGEENIKILAKAVNEFLKDRPCNVKDIIASIIDKTGVKGIDIQQAVNMSCEWDEDEQEIVDIFKAVQEARERIRERNQVEQTLSYEQEYEYTQL